jgi:hypothetical protein
MLFTSIVGAPKVIAVRVVEQPDELAKKIACVLLSTQTFTPRGSDVAAVATPPTRVAPSKNPAITFMDVLFISTSFVSKCKISFLP